MKRFFCLVAFSVDAILPRDWLLPAADELLERTPLLVLASLFDPAARALALVERPVSFAAETLRALAERRTLVVLLEAERARGVLERALEARRALEPVER